jgi:hypothetical protein
MFGAMREMERKKDSFIFFLSFFMQLFLGFITNRHHQLTIYGRKKEQRETVDYYFQSFNINDAFPD